MNVFAYSRVSSKGQVDGDGPERQRAAIDSFCLRHGLNVAASFFDAFTGTSEDRPQFSKLLDRSEEVEGIVVERMDRLARDLMVSELLLRECRERGLKVFCVDQGELIDMASNDGDPTRKLIRQMLGALAEWEKSALVKKLRMARERLGRNGGSTPFGAEPGEKETLAMLCKYIRDEKSSFQHAADRLNGKGFKTRTGVAWTAEVVRRIYRRTHPLVKAPADGIPKESNNINLYPERIA